MGPNDARSNPPATQSKALGRSSLSSLVAIQPAVPDCSTIITETVVPTPACQQWILTSKTSITTRSKAPSLRHRQPTAPRHSNVDLSTLPSSRRTNSRLLNQQPSYNSSPSSHSHRSSRSTSPSRLNRRRARARAVPSASTRIGAGRTLTTRDILSRHPQRRRPSACTAKLILP